MLNRDLFERLCAQYGVEWNEQYDTVMIREGDQVYPLSEDTLGRVFTEMRNECICLQHLKTHIYLMNVMQHKEERLWISALPMRVS
mgnify:CR=1 FL=1